MFNHIIENTYTVDINVTKEVSKVYGKDGKIEALELAFEKDTIGKKVAYMFANSHEYKGSPNVDAAIAFCKNYKWTEVTVKVDDIQGINKPVNKNKAFEIALTMQKDKGNKYPLICVDSIQGFTPQSKGKLILVDGHHREAAMELADIKTTKIYKGTFTGGSQISNEELIGKDTVMKESIDYTSRLEKHDHFKHKDYSAGPSVEDAIKADLEYLRNPNDQLSETSNVFYDQIRHTMNVLKESLGLTGYNLAQIEYARSASLNEVSVRLSKMDRTPLSMSEVTTKLYNTSWGIKSLTESSDSTLYVEGSNMIVKFNESTSTISFWNINNILNEGYLTFDRLKEMYRETIIYEATDSETYESVSAEEFDRFNIIHPSSHKGSLCKCKKTGEYVYKTHRARTKHKASLEDFTAKEVAFINSTS